MLFSACVLMCFFVRNSHKVSAEAIDAPLEVAMVTLQAPERIGY